MDVDALVESILGEMRKKDSDLFAGRLFRDEPILRTGKKMREQSPEFVPERIREMRRIALTDGRRSLVGYDARLFYEQGRFMEDYEDDCPFQGDFIKYFPTYDDLPDRVLRGYFTWRARYRAGNVERAPLSFLFMHAYEILCGIGVEPGQAGHDALSRLAADYRDEKWPFAAHLESWRRDYVIYHRLDPGLLEPSQDKGLLADAIRMMKVVEERVVASGRGEWPSGEGMPDRDAFLDALCRASTYRLERSAVMRDHRPEAAEVACAVFARMSYHCARRRKVGYVDGMFGIPALVPFRPFEKAVFHDPAAPGEFTFETPDGEIYTCHGTYWTRRIAFSRQAQSAELGNMLHAVDAELRGHFDDLPPLKERDIPKFVQGFVSEETADIIERRRQEEAARVVIDRSVLSGIRASAAVTREALLVDEERDDFAEEPGWGAEAPSSRVAAGAPYSVGGRPEAAPAGGEVGDALAEPFSDVRSCPDIQGLTEAQGALLRSLLDGGTPMPDAAGVSIDMEVDAINEAFYDLVGDTVIEFADGMPSLVEDYRNDVVEAIS